MNKTIRRIEAYLNSVRNINVKMNNVFLDNNEAIPYIRYIKNNLILSDIIEYELIEETELTTKYKITYEDDYIYLIEDCRYGEAVWVIEWENEIKIKEIKEKDE